jgi:hypothetical protein
LTFIRGPGVYVSTGSPEKLTINNIAEPQIFNFLNGDSQSPREIPISRAVLILSLSRGTFFIRPIIFSRGTAFI